jgi:hypothetical protein
MSDPAWMPAPETIEGWKNLVREATAGGWWVILPNGLRLDRVYDGIYPDDFSLWCADGGDGWAWPFHRWSHVLIVPAAPAKCKTRVEE